MNRREFLTAGVAAGVGLPAVLRAQPQGAKAIAKGQPLTPPEGRPVLVAIPLGEWNTWIDFDGPLAAFETYRKNPSTGKFGPTFDSYFVSDKLEKRGGGIIPDHTFEDAPQPDIILVGAQASVPGLLEWLKSASAKADITMSVCTGAYHLAEAGLLDGLDATSHHESIANLKKKYPKVNWISGMRFVEGEKISTGGGLTAGIDLGLRVCERYYGREWALNVASHIEYQGLGWQV